MAHFFDVARDSLGNAIASPTVTVHLAGTSTLATLYSNAALTAALANPFTGNADGTYEFYTAAGSYKVTVEKTGFTTFTADNIDVGVQPQTPAWFDVRDYGAVGNGVTNDAIAIDAAIAAATAALGGTVYFPHGDWIYNGAGIDFNPGPTTFAPVNLVGEGMETSVLRFTGVTNAQCIRYAHQAAIGSGFSLGGLIANLTITAPAAKNILVLQSREQCTVNNIRTVGGKTAITVIECQSCDIGRLLLQDWGEYGINIVAETYSHNYYHDAVIGSIVSHSSNVRWVKATAADAGGIVFFNISAPAVANATADGYHFEYTGGGAPIGMFIQATDCGADGAYATNGWTFKNLTNVDLVNPWGLTGSGGAGFEFDNCEHVSINGGLAASALYDLSFKNSCDYVTIRGMRTTGTGVTYQTDATDHTRMTIDNFPKWRDAATVSNNLARFLSTKEGRCLCWSSAHLASTSGAWLRLLWNVNLYDYAAIHSTSINTDRFTAPANGEYRFTCLATFDSNATGLRYVRALKQATDVLALDIRAAVNGDVTTASISFTVELTKSQYVVFEAFQNSGGALNVLLSATNNRRAWVSVETVKSW